MKEDSDDFIGDSFQQKTKYNRNDMSGGSLDWENQPDVYKEYKNATKIKLPAPFAPELLSFHDSLKLRKSIRFYSNEPLALPELSYLLWATTGIQREENRYEYRTAPSAGALYPIETYLVINNVSEIPQGIYHYSIKNHSLEEISIGYYGLKLAAASLGQKMCAEAAVVFIFSAIFFRSKWKYHQRAYRYIYLDAGHIAENLALTCTAMGLGGCHIGAIFDEEVNSIIGVDGSEESAIYLTAVGHKKLLKA